MGSPDEAAEAKTAEDSTADGKGDQSPVDDASPTSDAKRDSIEGKRNSIGGPESLAQRTRKAWLKNCRKIFDEFDADGGGSIDIGEFGDLLESSGLHFTPQDIDRICKEFDVNGDGEIDFDEFTTFLEAHGMGPGKGGTAMQMTDALRAINTTVKSNMLDLSDKDKSLIEQTIAAICPKGHHLEKVSLGELALERFYFGHGGFICMKCDIHSDNMCSKAAYLCSECQHVVCCMCAGLSRQERINLEIHRRTTVKMQGLSSFAKRQSTNDSQKVVRRGKKKGGQLRFDGGGVRMSLPSVPEPIQQD